MWICDTCGQNIVQKEDGWVEWLIQTTPTRVGKELRLVHSGSTCQYNEKQHPGFMLNDLPLTSFLGADGLITLLSFLEEEKIPKEEILEMIKRLHIPGYETARFHFNDAISHGIFEPNTAPGYYRQHDIDAVNEAVKSGKI